MSATLLEKAPAKINLTLRVLGRRADGYHEIESLVAFADFGDVLTLRTDAAEGLEITGPFGGKSGPIGENLVLKAVAAGRERVAGLKAGYFLLEKTFPSRQVSVAVQPRRRGPAACCSRQRCCFRRPQTYVGCSRNRRRRTRLSSSARADHARYRRAVIRADRFAATVGAAGQSACAIGHTRRLRQVCWRASW